MSKSLGNVYTISDLEKKGYSALDFRYFCLNAHYRKALNFTFAGLDGAKAALANLRAALAAHKAAGEISKKLRIENGEMRSKDKLQITNYKLQINKNEKNAQINRQQLLTPNFSLLTSEIVNSEQGTVNREQYLNGYMKQFADAINDDLNVPAALGILWTMVKGPKDPAVYEAALKMDEIFGLSLDKPPEEKKPETAAGIPPEIIALAEKRRQARIDKDYRAGDAIRAEIEARNYVVTDKPGNEYELKSKN